MTDRKQAIEDLKKMMAEQKARLDPQVLARATAAAVDKTAAAVDKTTAAVSKKPVTANATAAAPTPSSVPYDKEAAAKAVELFLKNHGNADDFSMKLFQFMKKNSQ